MDARSNESAFANTTNDVFANSQHPQFNAYDNLTLFPNTAGNNTSFNDAGWGVNASDFPSQSASRGPHPVQSWQQNNNANHLSAPTAHTGYSAQSPYGRPLTQSPVPYGQTSFNPQQYQYRQPQFNNNTTLRPFNSPAQNGGTVTPQALDRQGQSSNFTSSPYGNNATPQAYAQLPGRSMHRPVDQKVLAASVPKGADAGMFSVMSFDNLVRATNSERMGNFINIGKDALEWDSTRSAIPVYVARRSRNDLRTLAGNNTSVLAKLGKKSIKSRLGGVVPPGTSGSVSSPQIKYEHDSSNTEDSSSDDTDSDSDDEEDSPLPDKRPDSPKEAVEYDTIKALWRSKRKHLSSESIRKGLLDFWELVKVIRDRWKADAAAVTEAEEKKRAGELPLLQSRVKDQRDMIEAAFKAALKHGHRGIVELLAENLSLMYLCYQFLLDRFKAEDVDGSLARAILETMSFFTTLDKDKIEKTHLTKVLPRYQKKGNAKVKFWANTIVTNAEKALKEATAKKEFKKEDRDSSTVGDVKTVAPAKKAAEPVAGVKRAAPTASGEGASAKKVATGGPKSSVSTSNATRLNGVVKKPVSSAEAARSATATALPKKAVIAKPSGFFSSLQSASKKPGTSIADKATASTVKASAVRPAGGTTAPKPTFSFAETMANLTKPKEEKPAPKVQKEIPNETPEQRTRRLRKEQRRKLHVTFKPLNELVEVRYFTHDPEEEVDQGSSQKRDFSDVGGEGRMFKQQAQLMNLDDEDEAAEEAENLRDHKPPSAIDFSTISPEDRDRNYEPYGGGRLKPVSEERAVREAYESNNLIVFYTDPSQIPPNPKEPSNPYNGESGAELKYFGPMEEVYAARARAKRSQAQPYSFQMQQNAGGPPAAPDISSILASLAQAAPNPTPFLQAQPIAPSMAPPFMGVPTQQNLPVPPANIDLAAILASLNPGGNNPQQGGFGAAPVNFAPQPQMFDGSNNSNNDNDNDNDGDAKKHTSYKTKVCKFFQQGSCTRGDACTFVHE